MQNRHIHRDREQIRACQGREGWGKGSDHLMGMGFPFGEKECSGISGDGGVTL